MASRKTPAPRVNSNAPTQKEFKADDQATNSICTSIGPVLLNAAEQAAINAGKALVQAAQGLLTVANITKCLDCTGTKLKDDFDKIGRGGETKQPNCGDNDDKEADAPVPRPNKGVSRDRTGQPLNPGGDDSSYVEYPIVFDPSVGGPESRVKVGSNREIRTQWHSVTHTSVAERWRRQSSKKQS